MQISPNNLLVPTLGTARHVSWCFRGRRGTATRSTTKEKKMNRFVAVSLTALIAFVLSACASVDSKIYAGNKVQTVGTWTLEFAYESGAVEQLKRAQVIPK